MYILYIRVVSVFIYSLLSTLHKWIGEIRYPTKELMNIILVIPNISIPVNLKNDFIDYLKKNNKVTNVDVCHIKNNG